MSRHRIVRTMDFKDEYDGYDDVYGHSVDDDLSNLSPTDASQWIYDRAAGQQSISAFIKNNKNIEEEDEDEDENQSFEKHRRDSENFQIPELDNSIKQAQLASCIDEVRSVVGDGVSEKLIVDLALKYDFDVPKTLDAVLSQETNKKITDQQKPITFISKDYLRKTPEESVSKTQTDLVQVTKVIPLDKNIKKGFDLVQNFERSASPNGDIDENLKTIKIGRDKESVQKLYEKERLDEKNHLHMVVIGHVDAGKSTLMGHLLFDTGMISQRVMQKHEHESKKIGKQSFMYAWVLDETGEERARGITMDVGISKIETDSKSITLMDAPGHKDFIPNMISGAAQADVALLVVDATRGEFETGFEQGGQTREHALLVRSLGVSQLAVVINKLDTVNWSQDRFNEIVTKLKIFLKQAGFKDTDVSFIPCSGLTGENLVQNPTEKQLTKWYQGPTLFKVIDNFKIPERSFEKPFRMAISDIFKGTGSNFCVSGRIETGIVTANDKTLINPCKELAIIKNISIDEFTKTTAFAGDQVSLTLSGVDINNIQTGYVLCDPQNPIPIVTKIEARILIFNIKVPITIGYPVVLHHQATIEPATISKLLMILHKGTGEILKKKPRVLTNNSCALIEIETIKPICVELFSDCKEFGRIMLRIGGVTIAAGMITKLK